MIKKDISGQLPNLYLAIGLISFVLLLTDAVFRQLEDVSFYIHLSDFWHGIFVAWFLIGHLLYLENLSETKELFNIEEVLFYLVVTGFVTLPLSSLSEIFYFIGFNWSLSSPAAALYDSICNYFYVFYFITGLVLFRKLVFVKKNKSTIITWSIFFYLLVISVIFYFAQIEIPFALNSLYFMAAGIIGALLLVKIKWIANLKYKSKLICLSLLFIINLISLYFANKYFFTDDQYLFHPDMVRNVFMILGISFVNVYGVISFFALLFNLPISSEMEQKENEMSGFQEINKIIQDKFRKEDILEAMFTACYQNSFSEGGWLEAVENNEEKILKEINLSQDEITEFKRSIKTFNLLQLEKGRKLFYANNLPKDEDFYNVETNYKSLVVFPILSKDKLMGKVYLLKTYRNGFDEYMLNMVKTYADQTKLAFENSELILKTLETEQLKNELQIAHKVQQSLLPHHFPDNLYFDISAMSESAKEVGGDYYDFYTLDKNNYAVVIGDVSGKGTSAVFHMAEMKGIFQTLIPNGLYPKEFLMQVNTAVSRCFEKNLFITLSYFLIRCYQHKINFSRAGHCPLLYYKANEKKAVYIKEGGIGIGIVRDKSFIEHVHVSEIRFYSNDVMVLYTDGLTDARQKDTGKEYGYERLKQQLEMNVHLTALEIKNNIIKDLRDFVQDAPTIDDLTLLVIKFK